MFKILYRNQAITGLDFATLEEARAEAERRAARFETKLHDYEAVGIVSDEPEKPCSPWDMLRAAWKAGHWLPTDSAERKNFPVRSGCIEYIPAALAAFALGSKIGNDKHNPGQPLQHSRAKSSDHGDCQARHEIDCNDPNLDKLEELTWKFWRAGIELQLHAEELGAPKAPRAT